MPVGDCLNPDLLDFRINRINRIIAGETFLPYTLFLDPFL